MPNDLWRKRVAKPAGADIVAILDSIAVVSLEIVERSEGDLARLAIVAGILRDGVPRLRQAVVGAAALERGSDPRLLERLLGRATQPRQFRALRLCAGL